MEPDNLVLNLSLQAVAVLTILASTHRTLAISGCISATLCTAAGRTGDRHFWSDLTQPWLPLTGTQISTEEAAR